MNTNRSATTFRIALVATLAALTIGCAAAPPGSSSGPGIGSGPGAGSDVAGVPVGDPVKVQVAGVAGEIIPDQYIVTIEEDADAEAVAERADAEVDQVFEESIDGFVAVLDQEELAKVRNDADVVAIEQDQIVVGGGYNTQTVDAGQQPWGLDRIDQRSGRNRTYSWWSSGSFGAGAGVTAYVIDSGITANLAEFGGRARNVYDAFGGNGSDCHGHGTHVAGTIGGRTYGVAKSVRLVGLKVLGCDNKGSLSGIIGGLDWVRQYGSRPGVANISIEAPRSAALNAATTNLVSSGIFVAVAAGNSNVDACNISPASAGGTLTVASSDYTDTKAWNSNWGRCVDIYAPGVDIQSNALYGGVGYMSGTSMAAPHVAGVAALLKSNYPTLSPAQIVSNILSAGTNNVIRGNISGTPNKLLFMSGW